MRTEEMDFIEPLVCSECVDDAPEVKAINTGSYQLLLTHQVFIRTKKQPTTWNHASTPPSGAFSKLVSVEGAGCVDRGTDLVLDSMSRDMWRGQSGSNIFPLCSSREGEPMRTRERGRG